MRESTIFIGTLKLFEEIGQTNKELYKTKTCKFKLTLLIKTARDFFIYTFWCEKYNKKRKKLK